MKSLLSEYWDLSSRRYEKTEETVKKYTFEEVNVLNGYGPLCYKITNIITNECYIGQTTLTLVDRVFRHFKAYCLEDQRRLYIDMHKYGLDKFEIEILDPIESKSLDEQEQYYITKYNSLEKGYNETIGGKSFSYEASSNGGIKGAETCRKLKKGAFFDPSLRKEIRDKAGNLGALACKELKRGSFFNEEQHSIACRKASVAKKCKNAILILDKMKPRPLSYENFNKARQELIDEGYIATNLITFNGLVWYHNYILTKILKLYTDTDLKLICDNEAKLSGDNSWLDYKPFEFDESLIPKEYL